MKNKRQETSRRSPFIFLCILLQSDVGVRRSCANYVWEKKKKKKLANVTISRKFPHFYIYLFFSIFISFFVLFLKRAKTFGEFRMSRGKPGTRGGTPTHKLSIMGVAVQGLCVSLKMGIDFIRWYMGGHAISACRVWRRYSQGQHDTDALTHWHTHTAWAGERIRRWCSTSSLCSAVLWVAETQACVSASHSLEVLRRKKRNRSQKNQNNKFIQVMT